ncbi:hypothetical protein, partial [Helicobacter sp. 12S02232-10]
KAKGTLNLEGTSIGSDGLDLTQNASALNLNAIFDNRGVDTSIADYVTYKDTNSNTQTATTNAFGALSDS